MGYVLYYELNVDYIIETYCVNKDKPKLQCNGKCFLSKQLTLQSEKENTSQNQDMQIVEAFYPVYYQKAVSVVINSPFEVIQKENFPELTGKTSTYQGIIDPPPQDY